MCMVNKNEIEEIFRHNYKPMLILANRLLHDEDAAGDIVHDIFRSVLENKRVQIDTPYLLNAVRYACFNYMRNRSVRDRLMHHYSLDLESDQADTWPDEEDIAKLNSIIDKHLPERTRTILTLKFIKNLKYREIANELSISEVSVYKHLRHAIITLRQHFGNNEE